MQTMKGEYFILIIHLHYFFTDIKHPLFFLKKYEKFPELKKQRPALLNTKMANPLKDMSLLLLKLK